MCHRVHRGFVKMSNEHYSKQREWLGVSTVGKKKISALADN